MKTSLVLCSQVGSKRDLQWGMNTAGVNVSTSCYLTWACHLQYIQISWTSYRCTFREFSLPNLKSMDRMWLFPSILPTFFFPPQDFSASEIWVNHHVLMCGRWASDVTFLFPRITCTEYDKCLFLLVALFLRDRGTAWHNSRSLSALYSPRCVTGVMYAQVGR